MTLGAEHKSPRYIVISPVRNESQYLEKTIRSLWDQTIRPVQWILVNDGSSDRTDEIIEHWASKHPWILPVHRLDWDRHTPLGLSACENEFAGDGRPDRGKRACRPRKL